MTKLEKRMIQAAMADAIDLLEAYRPDTFIDQQAERSYAKRLKRLKLISKTLSSSPTAEETI